MRINTEHRETWRHVLAAVIFAALFAKLLQSSFLSINDVKLIDGKVFYVVGLLVNDGHSPYSREAFVAAYIDQFGPIVGSKPGILPMPGAVIFNQVLALLPWPVASGLLGAVTILAGLFGAVWLVLRLSEVDPVRALRSPAGLIGMSLVCMIGGVAASIYTGQPSLLAIAGALAAVHFAAQGRPVAGGLALLVASIKPPIVLFVVVVLVARRAWRVIGVGAFFFFASCVYVYLAIPTTGLWRDIAQSLAGYTVSAANRPPQVTGIDSLLHAVFGVSHPWLAIALGATAVWLAASRERAHLLEQPNPRGSAVGGALMLALLATGLFVPLKQYDAVIYIPLALYLAIAPGRLRFWYLPGFLLIARPTAVSLLLERVLPTNALPEAINNHVYTIGSLLLLLAWIAVNVNKNSAKPTSATTYLGFRK